MFLRVRDRSFPCRCFSMVLQRRRHLIVLHALRTFMATHVLELGRPSVAGPVFARVFGPQTGVQKNHFFRSLEGAKSLENL